MSPSDAVEALINGIRRQTKRRAVVVSETALV